MRQTTHWHWEIFRSLSHGYFLLSNWTTVLTHLILTRTNFTRLTVKAPMVPISCLLKRFDNCFSPFTGPFFSNTKKKDPKMKAQDNLTILEVQHKYTALVQNRRDGKWPQTSNKTLSRKHPQSPWEKKKWRRMMMEERLKWHFAFYFKKYIWLQRKSKRKNPFGWDFCHKVVCIEKLSG